MGDMIAQEITHAIPERICTLSIVSTASGLFNTSGFFENLANRANLFIPKPLAKQIEGVKYNLYTEDWLSQPDELEPKVASFPTNGYCFSVNELWKRTYPEYLNKKGFLAQVLVAG